MCPAIVPEGSYKIVGNPGVSVEYREEKCFWIVANDSKRMIFFDGFDQSASTVLVRDL